MAGWRPAVALLVLTAYITAIAAAPLNESTGLEPFNFPQPSDGCYYNFQHYGEGDRIMTNEPCLNCTCHNRMLMCYLRVCPFMKPVGQDCKVEKRADQCCPVVTCPDVPVDLLTSTSTTSPAVYGSSEVDRLRKYGCEVNDKYFSEGSKLPPTPNKPCELCYCIRNMTACVMQECTLHVDGCTPVYHRDVCCPVRYSCDHPEDEIPLLDNMTTTIRPTPGYIITTTSSPELTGECFHDGQIYPDGAPIKMNKACEHCYCMKGDMVCVVQECGTPMENEGKNCVAAPLKEGQCCPDTYTCDEESETTIDGLTGFTGYPRITGSDPFEKEFPTSSDVYSDTTSDIPNDFISDRFNTDVSLSTVSEYTTKIPQDKKPPISFTESTPKSDIIAESMGMQALQTTASLESLETSTIFMPEVETIRPEKFTKAPKGAPTISSETAESAMTTEGISTEKYEFTGSETKVPEETKTEQPESGVTISRLPSHTTMNQISSQIPEIETQEAEISETKPTVTTLVSTAQTTKELLVDNPDVETTQTSEAPKSELEESKTTEGVTDEMSKVPESKIITTKTTPVEIFEVLELETKTSTEMTTEQQETLDSITDSATKFDKTQQSETKTTQQIETELSQTQSSDTVITKTTETILEVKTKLPIEMTTENYPTVDFKTSSLAGLSTEEPEISATETTTSENLDVRRTISPTEATTENLVTLKKSQGVTQLPMASSKIPESETKAPEELFSESVTETVSTTIDKINDGATEIPTVEDTSGQPKITDSDSSVSAMSTRLPEKEEEIEKKQPQTTTQITSSEFENISSLSSIQKSDFTTIQVDMSSTIPPYLSPKYKDSEEKSDDTASETSLRTTLPSFIPNEIETISSMKNTMSTREKEETSTSSFTASTDSLKSTDQESTIMFTKETEEEKSEIATTISSLNEKFNYKKPVEEMKEVFSPPSDKQDDTTTQTSLPSNTEDSHVSTEPSLRIEENANTDQLETQPLNPMLPESVINDTTQTSKQDTEKTTEGSKSSSLTTYSDNLEKISTETGITTALENGITTFGPFTEETLGTVSSSDNQVENEIINDDFTTQQTILPHIPGEGDCLVEGVTYPNDSLVQTMDKCMTACRCVSSIIKCEQVKCNSPLEDMINCRAMYESDEACCPRYECDTPRQSTPSAYNQMAETETPMLDVSEETLRPMVESPLCTIENCPLSSVSDNNTSVTMNPEKCVGVQCKSSSPTQSLLNEFGDCREGDCSSLPQFSSSSCEGVTCSPEITHSSQEPLLKSKSPSDTTEKIFVATESQFNPSSTVLFTTESIISPTDKNVTLETEPCSDEYCEHKFTVDIKVDEKVEFETPTTEQSSSMSNTETLIRSTAEPTSINNEQTTAITGRSEMSTDEKTEFVSTTYAINTINLSEATPIPKKECSGDDCNQETEKSIFTTTISTGKNQQTSRQTDETQFELIRTTSMFGYYSPSTEQSPQSNKDLTSTSVSTQNEEEETSNIPLDTSTLALLSESDASSPTMTPTYDNKSKTRDECNGDECQKTSTVFETSSLKCKDGDCTDIVLTTALSDRFDLSENETPSQDTDVQCRGEFCVKISDTPEITSIKIQEPVTVPLHCAEGNCREVLTTLLPASISTDVQQELCTGDSCSTTPYTASKCTENNCIQTETNYQQTEASGEMEDQCFDGKCSKATESTTAIIEEEKSTENSFYTSGPCVGSECTMEKSTIISTSITEFDICSGEECKTSEHQTPESSPDNIDIKPCLGEICEKKTILPSEVFPSKETEKCTGESCKKEQQISVNKTLSTESTLIDDKQTEKSPSDEVIPVFVGQPDECSGENCTKTQESSQQIPVPPSPSDEVIPVFVKQPDECFGEDCTKTQSQQIPAPLGEPHISVSIGETEPQIPVSIKEPPIVEPEPQIPVSIKEPPELCQEGNCTPSADMTFPGELCLGADCSSINDSAANDLCQGDNCTPMAVPVSSTSCEGEDCTYVTVPVIPELCQGNDCKSFDKAVTSPSYEEHHLKSTTAEFQTSEQTETPSQYYGQTCSGSNCLPILPTLPPKCEGGNCILPSQSTLSSTLIEDSGQTTEKIRCENNDCEEKLLPTNTGTSTIKTETCSGDECQAVPAFTSIPPTDFEPSTESSHSPVETTLCVGEHCTLPQKMSIPTSSAQPDCQADCGESLENCDGDGCINLVTSTKQPIELSGVDVSEATESPSIEITVTESQSTQKAETGFTSPNLLTKAETPNPLETSVTINEMKFSTTPEESNIPEDYISRKNTTESLPESVESSTTEVNTIQPSYVEHKTFTPISLTFETSTTEKLLVAIEENIATNFIQEETTTKEQTHISQSATTLKIDETTPLKTTIQNQELSANTEQEVEFPTSSSLDYTASLENSSEMSSSVEQETEASIVSEKPQKFPPLEPNRTESPEETQPDQSGGYGADDYGDDEQTFGPGTCKYGGKVYVSAQQIPRDDPCDFCFCFRSDIICLQQSCPPPIPGCHEEPIQGFCCPRYECPVSMAMTLNMTTTTTTTTTTLPPHFLPHTYRGAAQKRGCQIKGQSYQVGEVVRTSSGPCMNCTCRGDGQMKCEPKACTPEPMLRQMIAAAVSSKRRR